MTVDKQKIQTSSCYQHSDSVAYREVAGEVLLVPIRKDAKKASGIYTLNRTASFLWKRIDGTADVGSLATAVAEHFDVSVDQATGDTHVFVTDLLSFGAIVEVDKS